MSDPDPAVAALDAAAEEAGVSREALLRRAIVSIAESEGVDVPDAEEVAAIEARLDDLDAELDAKVGDLRERFVELYRDVEAASTDAPDADAPDAARVDALTDDLESITGDVDSLTNDIEAITGDVDSLAARIDAIEAAADDDRLDGLHDQVAGLEERLDAVDDAIDGDADRLDEFDDKLSRLASAVVRVRRRLDAAESDRGDRDRAAELTRTANRNGVRTADCDNCGGTVRLGLLSAPECPHCERQFSELEPNTGFLGTSRLLVADPPAIDGDIGGEGDDQASAAASDGGSDGVR